MIDPTSLQHLLDGPLDRRQWVTSVSALATLFGLDRLGIRHARGGGTGPAHCAFTPIAASTADELRVPEGYQARVFFPWGTPVQPGGPAWSSKNTAADQRQQAGTHHDGIAFFPVDARWNSALGRLDGSSEHGYLAINHEYTDEGLLHEGGVEGWNAEKVNKSKAAQGISVIEVVRDGGEWRIVGGRRITGLDELEFQGPARGHPLLKSSSGSQAEQDGTGCQGTFGNCANGVTPWGTYLSCEENFQDYFARSKPGAAQKAAFTAGQQLADQRYLRYGIGDGLILVEGWRSTYGWDRCDPRFDVDRAEHGNHCHRYGWVVEIDPRDPGRKPVKRTALGRFRHENAAVVLAPDGRAVVYMGDDARFEYIYKFVSAGKFQPELPADDEAARARKREHNWTLLDDGRLYVARFDAGDTGRWIELSTAQREIAGSRQFATAAEVAIFARSAADLVQATRMDRPEWIAVDQDPATRCVRNVYVTLSNNNKRGEPGAEGPDAANPRADNVYGHIVRWRETDGDPTATTFQWSTFVLCGQRQHPLPEQRGNIKDAAGATGQDFGSPDGLTMDPRGGVLWVQTDVSMVMLRETAYGKHGNNQMLAIDVATAEVRRFLTGPKGCEITGLAFTPDCTTMFANVQHPGELPDAFSDPAQPLARSRWPDGATDGRPRSATVVITHGGGKAIGA